MRKIKRAGRWMVCVLSCSVGDRNKYEIHLPLPPKIDPTVTMMQVEEKPDVTYNDVGMTSSAPLSLYCRFNYDIIRWLQGADNETERSCGDTSTTCEEEIS